MRRETLVVVTGAMQMAIEVPVTHPGAVLKKLYLEPLGMSAAALAKAIGVPRNRIERILKQERGIGIDTALRLAKVFGSTPELRTNMQTSYELATERKAIAAELDKIKTLEHA
jgi:addiction module HigA family antidote